MQLNFKKYATLMIIWIFFFPKIYSTDFKKGTMEIGGNISGNYSSELPRNSRLNLGIWPAFGYYFTDLLYAEGSVITSYSSQSDGFSILYLGLGVASGVYFNLSGAFTLTIPIGFSISRPFELTTSQNVIVYLHTQYYFFIRPTLKLKISDHVILGNSLSIGSYYDDFFGDRLRFDRFNLSYVLSWSFIW